MKPIAVSQTAAPSFSSPTTTIPRGAAVALQSIGALDRASKAEKSDGGTFKRAVVAALVGITLLGAVVPAHADTSMVQAPQTSSLVMTHEATGPPGLAQQRFERFVNGANAQQSVTTASSSAIDARSAAAFDSFNAKLTQILHRDAASLAMGHRPVGVGDQVSQAQTDQLQKAFTDLVSEMPVGSFGPGFEQILEGVTGALGSDVDLATVRLKDVGKVGGDAAQALVKQLQKDHPVTFWSLAGVAAAGAATLGYTQGTDALQKLGIRPEVSTKLFSNDHGNLRATVGVHTGPKLSDPALTVGLRGEHTFDSGTVVRGGLQTRLQGKELGETLLNASMSTTTGLNVAGEVRFSGNDFKPIDAHLSATKQFDRWNVGADANYNFQNNRFTSSLSAGRTFDVWQKNDLDVQIRGSFDNQGSQYIGVGATLRF
jgi:hypothetical protein